MAKGKKVKKKKKVAPAPTIIKKKEAKKVVNPLFEKRPKNFGTGQATYLKRDLTHFIKWSCYIRLQRQKAIFYKWLKVLPTINQFTQALDRRHVMLYKEKDDDQVKIDLLLIRLANV
jgi:large subunit ribosomal protein L7Ae